MPQVKGGKWKRRWVQPDSSPKHNVTLNEKEIETLLYIIPQGCITLMADHEIGRSAWGKAISQYPNMNPPPEVARTLPGYNSSEKKTMFMRLQKVEKHLRQILEGKHKGRKARVNRLEDRFIDSRFLRAVREEVERREALQCKQQ